jgi:peptidoglycan/LPS O-acetylase OafA/YrhL
MVANSLPTPHTPCGEIRDDVRVKLPSLDGLRGLAVLLVVLGHYSLYIPEVSNVLTPLAKTGVWVFFMLSSFLLTRQMILVLQTPPRLNKTLRYFIRRVLRIFPLYYVTLALLIMLPQFSANMFGGRGFSLWKHALLVYPEGNFWAISVEFEYYFLIPVIALLFLRLRRFNPLLGPLFGVGLAWLATKAYYLSWIQIGFPVNYPHIVNYAHFFLLGSAVAIGYLYRSLLPRWTTYCASALFWCGVILQVFSLPSPIRDWILQLSGLDIAWWHWIAQHPGQMISCSALLVGVLLSEGTARFFSSRCLRFLGRISFSLYCLHILPPAYFGGWTSVLTPVGAVSAFFLISVALSYLTFTIIERPCMNLIEGPERCQLPEVSPVTYPTTQHASSGVAA